LKPHNFLKLFLGLAVAFLAWFPLEYGSAQQGDGGAVYIVQAGDSLWSIALRFRVSVNDLANANGIVNTNQLAVGAHLVIPGLEGVQGVLVAREVSYGETLRSLSRRYQMPVELLAQLNHLTSPAEFFAGAPLVLTEQNANLPATRRAMLSPKQSLLELAAVSGANPWSMVNASRLSGTWAVIPGDVLHSPGGAALEQGADGPSALPEIINAVTLKPSPYVQGKVALVRLTASPGISFSATLNDKELHFFPDGNGGYVALQGIHAMTKPGLYSLALTGTPDADSPQPGAPFTFSQAVYIRSGNYPFDPVLIVSPETIDPAVTTPEDAVWNALAAPFSTEKLWNGIFQSPAPEPFDKCWPSRFGNRRSYNGSAYVYFHSGLDFCGGVGIEIHAPAAGIVVFAGPLTVRGNATMIDHGWGVYTGYMHQSEILVKVGDRVETGQLIGKVGGTGRVTGPHLHWEVWAGGVQIDPLDWLEQAFPE
jgi:murein DD-endopeptidase MepM/ murein hydrolase activator NlpD